MKIFNYGNDYVQNAEFRKKEMNGYAGNEDKRPNDEGCGNNSRGEEKEENACETGTGKPAITKTKKKGKAKENQEVEVEDKV